MSTETPMTDSRDAEITRLRGWLERISLAPSAEGQYAACALLGAPVPASMVEADRIAGATTKHEYPSAYGPGTHWALDAGWEILDTVKPGLISVDVRSFLVGQIARRLVDERETVNSAKSDDPTQTRGDG